MAPKLKGFIYRIPIPTQTYDKLRITCITEFFHFEMKCIISVTQSSKDQPVKSYVHITHATEFINLSFEMHQRDNS